MSFSTENRKKTESKIDLLLTHASPQTERARESEREKEREKDADTEDGGRVAMACKG